DCFITEFNLVRTKRILSREQNILTAPVSRWRAGGIWPCRATARAFGGQGFRKRLPLRVRENRVTCQWLQILPASERGELMFDPRVGRRARKPLWTGNPVLRASPLNIR